MMSPDYCIHDSTPASPAESTADEKGTYSRAPLLAPGTLERLCSASDW